MTRTYTLPVISYGSEVPEPAIEDLAAWVSGRYGREGDLVSYMLDRSMSVQSGISDPSAGGLFYSDRILSSITGISGKEIVNEPAFDPELLRMDGRMVRSFGREVRMSIPAPSVLDLTDSYFEDNDEFTEEIARLYLSIMRLQRDAGVPGHVLIADRPGETETEMLSSQRIRFYIPDPDREAMETVLEHQRDVALPASKLSLFIEMLENFEIRSLSVVDAEKEDLQKALEYFDTDQLSVGGYCTGECGDYWRDLRDMAIIQV